MYKKIVFGYLMVLLLLCSCQKWVSTQKGGISDFPATMVGVWEVQVGERDIQKWAIRFEKDGSVPKIIHLVAGPMVIKEGGVAGEGPDPNTYFMFVLGPTTVEYNSLTELIKAEIIIDKYQMKLPAGMLEGRLIDKFSGPASKDGQMWEVEWREYGWLEGAQEPDIKDIDKHPQKIIFKKLDLEKLKEDPNSIANN